MSGTVIADLREQVGRLEQAAERARLLLSGVVDPAYGSTKTIHLGRVLGALVAAADAANTAIARITEATAAAGARENAAVGRG